MDHNGPPASSPDGEQGAGAVAARPAAWLLWLAAAVGVAVFVIVALVVAGRSSQPPGVTPQQLDRTVQSAVDKGIQSAKSAPPDAAQVYQAILPSLVIIRAERGAPQGKDSDLGSGIVVNAKGQILTARHVVAGARTIEVSFSDGTKSSATVVNDQPATDIAVLQPETPPEVIVPAVLGASGGLRVGDEAFAVGHPLGLTGSLTAGVVSGLGRSAPIGGGVTLKGLIQFDAAVNPGSSGGPLLDRNGQVIGIVTALANPSEQGFFIGIGFAVPIATAGGAAGAPER